MLSGGSTIPWDNSLWPCNAKWWHRSGSTLAQVMACCLTAPSHYLSQWWFSLLTSCEIHLTAISQQVPWILFCIMSLKITLSKKLRQHLPGGQQAKIRKESDEIKRLSLSEWPCVAHGNSHWRGLKFLQLSSLCNENPLHLCWSSGYDMISQWGLPTI